MGSHPPNPLPTGGGHSKGQWLRRGLGAAKAPPARALAKLWQRQLLPHSPGNWGQGAQREPPARCGAGAARGSWWRCSRALSHEAATLLQAVLGSGPALLQHAQNLCPGLGPAVPQPRSPPCPSRRLRGCTTAEATSSSPAHPAAPCRRAFFTRFFPTSATKSSPSSPAAFRPAQPDLTTLPASLN